MAKASHVGITLGLTSLAAASLYLWIISSGDNIGFNEENIRVHGNEGIILGQRIKGGGMFRGIPYSQPPVGDHRFRNPREPLPYPGGVWNATYNRPSCVQTCTNPAPQYSCPQEPVSEDCLYLNIWIPNLAIWEPMYSMEHKINKNAKVPVMVYFHGGNFRGGSGSVVLYDSRYLVEDGDVVVVTLNYRLGPLAFLYHGEGDDMIQGNYGIRDQLKALNWIKLNIEFFGGDREKVTLFGQSAGAESIGVLLTLPEGKGLYNRVIMQSNPFGLPFRPSDVAQTYGNQFVDAIGCPRYNYTCIRGVSQQVIDKAERKVTDIPVGHFLLKFQPWGPVINTTFIPRQPVDDLLTGDFSGISIMTGTVTGEGLSYIMGEFRDPVPDNLYLLATQGSFEGKNVSGLIGIYPPTCKHVPVENQNSNRCDNRLLMSQVVTKWMFSCAGRSVVSSFNSSWVYTFDHLWSFGHVWKQKKCAEHVCHGSELPYMFNIEKLTDITITDSERRMARRMVKYWTNFAKYGDPNGLGEGRSGKGEISVKYWPKFRKSPNGENFTSLTFNDEADIVVLNKDKELCQMLDQIGYGL